MKPMNDRHLAVLRRHMVEVIGIHFDLLEQELGKATLDERVAEVMSRVPRHLFVPEQFVPYAYQDMPLPIGFEKTISQPFTCALMTDLLAPGRNEKVLEVGTGLGYQTAILAELAGEVCSVEIVEEFTEGAQLFLGQLGYTNVRIRTGDGSRGWLEHAPFDKIMVTAAAEQIPPALLEQFQPTGRLVMPLGHSQAQQLTIVERNADGAMHSRAVMPVRFTQLETVT